MLIFPNLHNSEIEQIFLPVTNLYFWKCFIAKLPHIFIYWKMLSPLEKALERFIILFLYNSL